MNLRTCEQRDEVRVAVDQPRARDRRDDEQQRDGKDVHLHEAEGGRDPIAHQRQKLEQERRAGR